MTTILTDPPLTSTEVLAVLADARTWPRCPNCGRPKLAALDGPSPEETPCVNMRPANTMAPHHREVLDRLLDRTGAHVDSDGHALIECDQPALAKQMAALLRHLGADARAIYLGGTT